MACALLLFIKLEIKERFCAALMLQIRIIFKAFVPYNLPIAQPSKGLR
jgi:hypothetical protein